MTYTTCLIQEWIYIVIAKIYPSSICLINTRDLTIYGTNGPRTILIRTVSKDYNFGLLSFHAVFFLRN